MKKIGLLTLALLVLGWISVPAEVIKGNVIDTKGEAMPFVTISVLSQDSTLVTGAITDDDGNWSLDIGDRSLKEVILQASFVGYQTAFGGPDFVLRSGGESEETAHRASNGQISGERKCESLVSRFERK